MYPCPDRKPKHQFVLMNKWIIAVTFSFCPDLKFLALRRSNSLDWDLSINKYIHPNAPTLLVIWDCFIDTWVICCLLPGYFHLLTVFTFILTHPSQLPGSYSISWRMHSLLGNAYVITLLSCCTPPCNTSCVFIFLCIHFYSCQNKNMWPILF